MEWGVEGFLTLCLNFRGFLLCGFLGLGPGGLRGGSWEKGILWDATAFWRALFQKESLPECGCGCGGMMDCGGNSLDVGRDGGVLEKRRS